MAVNEDISTIPALTESQFLTVMEEDNLSINSIATSQTSLSNQTSHYRAEVEKRLEAKRRAKEEEYTYKPQIFSKYKSERAATDEKSSRFDRLYDEARRRQSKEPRALPDSNVLTFQPTLTTRSSSRGRRSPSPTSEMIARLSQARKPTPEPEQPSFKPKITKRASSVERRHEDIADRLIQKAESIKQRLEKKRAEKQEEVAELCPFSPAINPASNHIVAKRRESKNGSSEGSSEAPAIVTDRLLQYATDREQRLQRLRAAKEINDMAGITFAPDLSGSRTHSRASTPNKHNSVTEITERLSIRKPAQEYVDEACTFQPQINEKSRTMTPATSNLPVYERLLLTAQAKKQEWDEMLQQIQEEERRRNIPRVNSRSVTSPSNGEDSIAGSEQSLPVFDRLSKANQKQELVIMMNQLKDELEMTPCTFHPAVSGPSSVGGSVQMHHEAVPIFDRLNAEALQMKLAAEKRELLRQHEEVKGATFKPKLLESQYSTRSRDTTPIHLRLNAEAEKMKKEADKREALRQQEELKGATFQPVVKGIISSSKQRHSTAPVHDRLNSEADKMRERQRALKETYFKEGSKENTFTPELSAKAQSSRPKSYLWWNNPDGTTTSNNNNNNNDASGRGRSTDMASSTRRSSSASRVASVGSSNTVSKTRSSSAGRPDSKTKLTEGVTRAGVNSNQMSHHVEIDTESSRAHHHHPDEMAKLSEGVIGAGLKSNQFSHHAELETAASRAHHEGVVHHHHELHTNPRATSSPVNTGTTVVKKSVAASPINKTPSSSTLRTNSTPSSIPRMRSASAERSNPSGSMPSSANGKGVVAGRVSSSSHAVSNNTILTPAKQSPASMEESPIAGPGANSPEMFSPGPSQHESTPWDSPSHQSPFPAPASGSKIPVMTASKRQPSPKPARGRGVSEGRSSANALTPSNRSSPPATNSVAPVDKANNGSSGKLIDRNRLKQLKQEIADAQAEFNVGISEIEANSAVSVAVFHAPGDSSEALTTFTEVQEEQGIVENE